MTFRTSHSRGALAALALLAASSVFAAEPETGSASAPSPELRQQMAAVHQKMADCLRSTRPIADCRAEMVSSCQQLMGDSGCPMMGSGSGGMGPGMMGGGKMMGPPAPETPKKK
ncbi:MAG: hypothetical protein ACHQ6T_07225 [Myxococcota bacterium]